MASENTSAYNYLKEELEQGFGNYNIFKSVIPYVKKWEEGDIFGELWVEREPKHKASKRYYEFVEEYLKNKEEA